MSRRGFAILWFAGRALGLPLEDCSDTCGHASDGDCDDGGSGAEYVICAGGTDCVDCGPRGDTTSSQCSNTCAYASDNDCDDGGTGTEYTMCNLGSDCMDCGPRSSNGHSHRPHSHNPIAHSHAPHNHDQPVVLCEDSCSVASDNDCDDGGVGAEFAMCGFGTDCLDCGPRTVEPGSASRNDGACDDTCAHASDGDCDDGGPGAEYNLCLVNSDCTDCTGSDVDDGGSIFTLLLGAAALTMIVSSVIVCMLQARKRALLANNVRPQHHTSPRSPRGLHSPYGGNRGVAMTSAYAGSVELAEPTVAVPVGEPFEAGPAGVVTAQAVPTQAQLVSASAQPPPMASAQPVSAVAQPMPSHAVAQPIGTAAMPGGVVIGTPVIGQPVRTPSSSVPIAATTTTTTTTTSAHGYSS